MSYLLPGWLGLLCGELPLCPVPLHLPWGPQPEGTGQSCEGQSFSQAPCCLGFSHEQDPESLH